MPKGETAKGNALLPFRRDASIIVVTGPSASGKSTLAEGLACDGWVRIDGDALARSLYVPGCALMKRLAAAFGRGILNRDGSLNRVRLGEIVFPSSAQRKRLNHLVHPAFVRALRREARCLRARGRKVVADVAVYFECGAPDLGAPVVLVQAPLALRIARLRAKGLPLKRAAAQARALRFGARERAAAHLVLDGGRPKRELHKALKAFLSAGPWPAPTSRR